MIALLCTNFINSIANCIFCLDSKLKVFVYLQGYAYDVYFTTIVYQVARRLMLLKKGSQYFKHIFYTVHTVLILILIFLTVRFIISIIDGER